MKWVIENKMFWLNIINPNKIKQLKMRYTDSMVLH